MLFVRNKYITTFLSQQAKIFIHKTGQIILRPIWNYLPKAHYGLCLAIVNTMACNANCVFCAYQFLPTAERIFMPPEIFDAVVEGIKHLTFPLESVHFTSNSGEPLLDREFLGKVRSLRKAGVKQIRLTTNGIAIDTFGAEALLDCGLDVINISTTPFREDMYSRIYRSGQFERMRGNVLALLELNKRRKSKSTISIILHSDIPEKEVRKMPETKRLMEFTDNIEVCVMHGDWLGLIKKDMLPGCMDIEKPKPLSRRPCLFLLTVPAVYPNGDITACVCRNIKNDQEMLLGNIREVSLDTAMRRLLEVSAKWRSGAIPSTCYRCTMYGDPSYYWPNYFKLLLSGNSIHRYEVHKES